MEYGSRRPHPNTINCVARFLSAGIRGEPAKEWRRSGSSALRSHGSRVKLGRLTLMIDCSSAAKISNVGRFKQPLIWLSDLPPTLKIRIVPSTSLILVSIQWDGRANMTRMLRQFAAILGLAMSASAQKQPPRILEVYRDFLKPRVEAVYRPVEEDASRICAELNCPHSYLAIESLTGPKEVWFLNGYDSVAELKQVADAYEKNAPLLAALDRNVDRKRDLRSSEPFEVFASYRQDLSRGVPWTMGQGRFLVIAIAKERVQIDGTVFETDDRIRWGVNGTHTRGHKDDHIQLVVNAAQTREQADALAAATGPQSIIFAVRPYWGMPATEWIAADPSFWCVNARAH
jgi:hypothetical protein